MRVGYIREGRPWSIAIQATMLVDYGCETYWVEGPCYQDLTEWDQLISMLRAGDEVVVMSLLVFGASSQQVNKALVAISQRRATLINWGEVFYDLPQHSATHLNQVSMELISLPLTIVDSDLADMIRAYYITMGWSVSELSGHFSLPLENVREVLFLTICDETHKQ